VVASASASIRTAFNSSFVFFVRKKFSVALVGSTSEEQFVVCEVNDLNDISLASFAHIYWLNDSFNLYRFIIFGLFVLKSYPRSF